MRILHAVESYYPSVGGMQEVVKQLSEHMVALGHDVTVATRIHPARDFSVWNGVNVVSFDLAGNEVRGYTGKDKDRYQAFLKRESFDVVTFFAAQQWATDLALPILKEIRGIKVNVPTGYSALFDPEYRDYYQRMQAWIHDYDMNIYLSDDYRDIDFARKNGVTRARIIPNGASEIEFGTKSIIDVRKELSISSEHHLVLHVGSFTGLKGHREAVEIFQHASIRNATLLLIGNDISIFNRRVLQSPSMLLRALFQRLLKGKRIVAIEPSRAFTVAAYQQSQVFLFPSYIECSPLVLFESCAAGLPFLTTPAGNAVEIAKWTQGGLIMPSDLSSEGYTLARIDSAAHQLEELLNDQNRRRSLSEQGKSAWKKRFTWEQITKEYLNLYKELSGANT